MLRILAHLLLPLTPDWQAPGQEGPQSAVPVVSEESLPAYVDAGESTAWGTLTENLRRSLDLSLRGAVNGRTGEVASVAALGVDTHTVLSGESRDIGTLTLQLYLTRIDNMPMRPVFFEEEDDWELVFRIFSYNAHLTAQRELNLRIGHLEIPFGVETLIDTNGTLRQYLHGPNLGVIADWGASLNGELEGMEYEVGWSRGTGNEWTDRGDPGVVFGRVGTDRYADTVAGLSFFDGKVLTPAGVIERSRYGADVSHYVGALGLAADVSVGRDFDTDVYAALAETNWRNSDETVDAWLQVRDLGREINGSYEDTLSTQLGCRYVTPWNWTLSAQWTQTLSTIGDGHRDGVFTLQFRTRF